MPSSTRESISSTELPSFNSPKLFGILGMPYLQSHFQVSSGSTSQTRHSNCALQIAADEVILMNTLDPDIVAVAFSLLLYVFYVLLPVVPAVIIYKLFPETKVALSGPFQNFTLNATGAFAAYIVTAGLGYFWSWTRHT